MNRFRGQRGVTLVEALIALVVCMVAVLGLYELMDVSNKLTKQQTDVAEAQDSVRLGLSEVARIIRQARVGGLYYGNAILPTSNNISGGTSLTDLSGDAHFIRQGTDVITVRGVIESDHYTFVPTDVTCSPCDGSAPMSITIRATTPTGVTNFATGSVPSLANAATPFYFLVADGSHQVVTVNGSSYLVPHYFVGRVDTTGSWYTTTANTFTFTMDPADAGARALDAPAAGTPVLSKAVSGGAVDEIVFFVDEGGTDGTGSTADTHPSLAEAVRDPATGNYRVQTLVEEVEDFQLAYGIEGIDGTPKDGGVSPVRVDESGTNKDEWVGNVAGEIEASLPISSSAPRHVDAFLDSSVPSGASAPLLASAALRSVWISLVVKSVNPDFVYDGPGARGLKTLDSTAVSFSSPASTGRAYRRRALSLAVSLRNYE